MNLSELVTQKQIILLGKKVLFLQKDEKRSDRLLVVMSAHNQADKYMALRSFIQNQVCDLLFVTDPANSWYLDQDQGQTYQDIFSNYTVNYNCEKVFFFGSSMSGYGAILHALRLNANAIAANPQINLDITKDYAWPELVRHIEDLAGHHINIDESAERLWQDSAVYILHGHDDIDVVNTNLLTRSKPYSKKLIIQSIDIDSHVMPFGREVAHVYNVMDVLGPFREKLVFSGVAAEISATEDPRKRLLRLERAQSAFSDPYRCVDWEGEGVNWLDRYKYQQSGKFIRFINIGLYHRHQVTGAMCIFDGARWRLVAPKPTTNENLINTNISEVRQKVINPANNSKISEFWWIRSNNESDVAIESNQGDFFIEVTPTLTKNIYISTTVSLDDGLLDRIEGTYLTLSGEIYTDTGSAHLALGGYGNNGYHHRNSTKSTPGKWTTLTVTEQFLSISKEHKDCIFARVDLASDGKSKRVMIKNLSLTHGYFPMGLG